jgi:hypothetical protein
VLCGIGHGWGPAESVDRRVRYVFNGWAAGTQAGKR